MQALNCTTARQASSLRAGPSGRHVVPSAPLRKRRSGLQTTQAFGGETDIVTAVAPTVAALVLGGVLLALPGSEQETGHEGSPACPRCHGSGWEECHCTRWSDGDAGCSSCSGAPGRMKCRSCGGGGKAVPVYRPVKIEMNSNRPY